MQPCRTADPLHWAQAKCYGFIYAHDHALEQITIQLTYLDLDTGQLTEFRNGYTLAELAAFFEEATAIYLDWLSAHQQWCRERDESIRSLTFPFARYRPGQRQLAVAAYQAGAHLLPHRAHGGTRGGREGMQRLAPNGAPPAHTHADRQRESVRSGKPTLRPAHLRVCSGLL